VIPNVDELAALIVLVEQSSRLTPETDVLSNHKTWPLDYVSDRDEAVRACGDLRELVSPMASAFDKRHQYWSKLVDECKEYLPFFQQRDLPPNEVGVESSKQVFYSDDYSEKKALRSENEHLKETELAYTKEETAQRIKRYGLINQRWEYDGDFRKTLVQESRRG
jgi:hypothetical protein